MGHPISPRSSLDLKAIEQDAFNLAPPEGIIIQMPTELLDFAARAGAQARQEILADQRRKPKGPPIAQQARLDRSSYQDPTRAEISLSLHPLHFKLSEPSTSGSRIDPKDLPPRAPRPHQNA